jgi:hypothetical protein
MARRNKALTKIAGNSTWSVRNYLVHSIAKAIFLGVTPSKEEVQFVKNYLQILIGASTSPKEVLDSLPKEVAAKVPVKDFSSLPEWSVIPSKDVELFREDFIEIVGKYATLRALGLTGGTNGISK